MLYSVVETAERQISAGLILAVVATITVLANKCDRNAAPAVLRTYANEHTNKPCIVVLGAGFGGLKLSTLLSETFGHGVDVTLIDKSDAFVFGYSKLVIMFGRSTVDAVRMPHRNFMKPGVRLLQSQALVAAFEERLIKFIPDRRVVSVNAAHKVATLDNGVEMAFDLFLGVPKHRVPNVVVECGMAEDGWIWLIRARWKPSFRMSTQWVWRQHRHSKGWRVRRRFGARLPAT